MILDSTQEAELIKKLVKRILQSSVEVAKSQVEEFNSRGIDTKILIYG